MQWMNNLFSLKVVPEESESNALAAGYEDDNDCLPVVALDPVMMTLPPSFTLLSLRWRDTFLAFVLSSFLPPFAILFLFFLFLWGCLSLTL